MTDYYPTILGSASAGLISRVVCHPIDTIKSRLQAGQSAFRSVEGIGALYRGVGAVVVGGVPGVCIYMTTYEICKEKFLTLPIIKDSPFVVYVTAGMIAEAVCCIVFVPVDVVKERLQVQIQSSSQTPNSKIYASNINGTLPQYTGSLDAFKQICQQEGLRGIYRGYGATLMSYGPFSALYFFLYEELKKRRHLLFTSLKKEGSYAPNDGSYAEEQPMIFWETLQCSAIAGGVASAVTNPLDLAKLRLQIERGSSGNAGGGGGGGLEGTSGLRSMLRKVYRQEGWRGLFRGAGARVLFHTPSTAITMAVFEDCKRRWSEVLHHH